MKRVQFAQHLPSPMLPTLVDEPFNSPEWIFETKWDGVRAICAITRKDVYAVSRTGRDLVPQFPELAKLLGSFKNLPLIIDGEIVSLDAKGRSSFQRLQPRINRLRGATDVRVAVSFAVFDVLMIGGVDVRHEPLGRRKSLLKKCIRAGQKPVFVSTFTTGDGVKAFDKARRQKLEGVVAKRLDSAYGSGRSRDWLKIKVVASQEFVICGWTEPRRIRKFFGALLLGIFEQGTLTYAGHVGTGFDQSTLAALHHKLARLETKRSPFGVVPKVNSPVHWAKPKLVAEIKFGEWTREGVLRQPVYLGLRVDKRPRDCVRPRLPLK